ncbi:valine--tRNA ligase [Chondrinema litorale]|uniref:valine--tRNA ligase n=1 Tax=Chondrinema litorale TaxID=2994555 RepID=UPI003D6F4EE0
MEMNKTYNPLEVEDKWYQYWMDKKYFASKPNPDKEPYTIVIPPPNVTGVLHMGHMLNNTIQDVLIRRARMQGKEACWVPGTDHASIATEAKVVKMLAEMGISKKDLTREEFLNYAWEWKEKYGGIILEQLKKLGASCDWDRTRFTMEEELSKAVIKVFVDLYKKGYIYRGARMVNWDPQGKTALSDEEVIHKEVQSKLYYVKYKIKDTDEWLTIATTRPETILGDTAVCVNPNDDRYKHLVGKQVIVPIAERAVNIIADEYVDMEFGTGCLKITPAHDINDYEIGLKHNLETIDTLNDDGTLSEAAGHYIGEDRFVVRKKIAKELEEKGQIEKIDEITNNVGFSERTDAVIEPRISTQWFIKMKEISKPAYENVMNDNIQLVPPKFKNTYRHWMENVKDWCISRQLWWGHQIPAFYLPDGSYVVAETAEEALELAKEKQADITADQLVQDEDVLDTWASSWLWPISVFDGITKPDNEDINYYYPTNDLVTAPEILFFWVARMIIAGYEYRGEMPFKNVYLTGIVRDKQRRKMSKQLGNSPDPLDLIKQYGADGIRTGMLFSSPAGNDLLFDEKLCQQGSQFLNKIWNALRLVKGWEVKDEDASEANKKSIEWFEARFNQVLAEIEDHYSKFRISDALMGIYKLFWNDFCDWYLEMIKPAYQQPVDKVTLEATLAFFEKLMKVLHPFMPFISEELWHIIKERDADDCLIVAAYPEVVAYDKQILAEANAVFEAVTKIRSIRSEKQIAKHAPLELFIKTAEPKIYNEFGDVLIKLGSLSQINFTENVVEDAASFVYKADEFYIPLADQIDPEQEREKLQKELEYTEGLLKIVDKKLSNERFVNNAPEAVVGKEKQKKADAESKITSIKAALAKLN